MLNIVIKLLIGCLSIFITVAHADEWDTVSKLSVENEQRNAHFSLAFGRTDIKGDVFHHQGSLSKLQGGYRFSDYFAFEAGFVFYGESDDLASTNQQEISGGAIEAQFMLIAPLLSWFEPYGILGISSWLFDVKEVPDGIESGTGEFEGNDFIFGAGFLFNVDHDSSLRLEYEMSSFKDQDFDMDIKQVVFGIQHRF